MTQILGIVNITRDSFSDGGKYLRPEAAARHARRLIAEGAGAIDLGAESTGPDAQPVSTEEEIARLTPVIRELKDDGVRVSVDTHKPTVMREVLRLGVEFINDVTGFRDPEAVAAVRESDVRLIVMHSRSAGPRAERIPVDAEGIVDEVERFFEHRIEELAAAGIGRERLILDPGMGLFLGANADASLTVLRDLKRLRRFGLPLLVSTSRKSVIGAALARESGPPPTDKRAAGTLASELWAATQGASYIRTHDVCALRDALRVWSAIAAGTVKGGACQRGTSYV